MESIIDILKEAVKEHPKAVVIATMILGGAIIISNMDESKQE